MPGTALPRPAIVTLSAGAIILGAVVALSPPVAALLAVIGIAAIALLTPLPAGSPRTPLRATVPTPRAVMMILAAAVALGAIAAFNPLGAVVLVVITALTTALVVRLPAPGGGLALGRPFGHRGIAALLVGAVILGGAAAWQPATGLGLAIAAFLATIVIRSPLPRLGVVGIIAAAVAGILGPNLALPQAPQLFGFRIIIVLMGVGLTAYLLVDGRLPIPRAMARPASFLLSLNVWSTISILWADNMLSAVRWTFFLLMMSGLALGIAIACRRRENAVRLLIVLGITFMVAALLGLAEIRLGFRLPTSQLLGRSSDAATSLFGNQNNFATYLTLSLPYFLCLPVVLFRDRRMVIVGVFGTVLTLACLMFTGSRSNLLATGLILTGLVLFLLIYGRGLTRFLGVMVAGLVVLLVVPSLSGNGILPIPEEAVTKFDVGLLLEQRKQQMGSGAVREAVLVEGLDQVRQSGGIGIGAGNAEARLLTLDSYTGVDNLHNWWLELLVNLGIPGFVVFAGMYLTLFRRQARIARTAEDPLVRWLALAGTLSLLGFVIGAMGPSSVIHFAPMWIVFGLGMLTLVLARDTRDTTE